MEFGDLTKVALKNMRPTSQNFQTSINLATMPEGPSKRFTLDLLNLIASIPYRVFDATEYSFNCYTDETGELHFGFFTIEPQEGIELINDEFAALAQPDLVEATWNDTAQIITFDNPANLYKLVIEMCDSLYQYNFLMAEAIRSAATSIANDYYPSIDSEKLSNPVAQLAIKRGLMTVVKSFDNASDFTVTAFEHEGMAMYRIHLGKNSETPFSKRFETLHIIHDEFDVHDEWLDHGYLELSPCETEIVIGFGDLKGSARFIQYLYNDLGIPERAIAKQIPFFINIPELNACIDNKGKHLNFRPYQH